MPFPFTCPSCRHTSQVPDSLAGTQARCPTCSMVVSIPTPAPFRATPASTPPISKLAPTIGDDRPTSRSSEVRTAPPAQKKSGWVIVLVVILVAGFFGFFCCGGLGLAGFLAFRHSASRDVAQGPATFVTSGGRPTRTGPASPTKPATAIDESKLPLSHWIALLRDGGPGDALKARTKLLAAGSAAVPELRKALTDKDPRMRLAATALLGEMGEAAVEAIDDIAKRLNESESPVRETAVTSLGQIGKKARSVYPEIVRASADPNRRVQQAAAETLRILGPPGKDDVPKLLPLLSGNDVERKLANAKALDDLKADPEVRQALFAPALRDSQLPVRLFAIRVVAAGGSTRRAEALSVLYPLLDDGDPEVRGAAMSAIKSLGPATVDELSALQNGLASAHADTRRYCIEALASLGAKAEPALPFLARALRDSDPVIRTASSGTLAKIGKPAREVVADLIQACNDREPEVRKNVALALAAIGREPRVVETLFLAVGDAQSDVRQAACDGLKRLQPPLGTKELTTLYPLLESPHLEVRRFTAAELARMGKEAAPVLVKIQDALGDKDPEVRASLYVALGEIGPKARTSAPVLLDAMREALRNPNQAGNAELFRQGAVALTKIGETTQALPLLCTALKDKTSPLLKDVLQVLATKGLDARSAAPELLALLDKPANRQAVAQALARIGKPVLDDLIKTVDKGNRDEKLGAILALQLMGPDAKAAFVDLRQLATTSKDKEIRLAAAKAMLEINR